MAAWTLPKRIAEWCEVLRAGLDRRSRKYLVPIILGMLLASGRRTVASWLRAAGVAEDWQDHDYFLQTLGRRAGRVATKRLFLVVRQIPFSHVGPYVKLALDDSPTKRYGPQVELAAPLRIESGVTTPRPAHRVRSSCTAMSGSRSAGW